MSKLKDILKRAAEAAIDSMIDPKPVEIVKRQETTPTREQDRGPLMQLLFEALKDGNPIPANVEATKVVWTCRKCGCRRELAVLGGLNPNYLDHDGYFDAEKLLKSLVCPECGTTADSL